jgi:PAS domain-containing protein
VADDVLRHVKDGHSLAIVDTVREALIVLDRDLRVVAASRSFYQTFGANPQGTQASCSTTSTTGSGTLRRCADSSRMSFRSIAPSRATRSSTSFRPSDGTMLLNARQVFEEEHQDSTLLLLGRCHIVERRIHEDSASRIFSNDRDCLVPHVHSRRAKGSVCL